MEIKYKGYRQHDYGRYYGNTKTPGAKVKFFDVVIGARHINDVAVDSSMDLGTMLMASSPGAQDIDQEIKRDVMFLAHEVDHTWCLGSVCWT